MGLMMYTIDFNLKHDRTKRSFATFGKRREVFCGVITQWSQSVILFAYLNSADPDNSNMRHLSK